MTQRESQSQHIFTLAKELLDDIELKRLNSEALILKATRLARFTSNSEVIAWLKYELQGYNSENKLSLKYMGRTGRWTDRGKKEGYWGPLSEHEATIQALKLELQALQLPSLSGDHLTVVVREIMRQVASTRNYIATFESIRGKVLSLLHSFVTEVYYDLLFSGVAESIFDQYKSDVDILLANEHGAVLERLPAVYSRLTEGDTEAVSQALTTIRRIVDTFADTVQPPINEVWEHGGNSISLSARHHQNRINYWTSCESSS